MCHSTRAMHVARYNAALSAGIKKAVARKDYEWAAFLKGMWLHG